MRGRILNFSSKALPLPPPPGAQEQVRQAKAPAPGQRGVAQGPGGQEKNNNLGQLLYEKDIFATNNQ